MEYRKYLKNPSPDHLAAHPSDQQKGLVPPPVEKPVSPDASLIPLIPPEQFSVGDMPLRTAIHDRRSRRKYSGDSMTLEEFSYLL